MNFDYIDKNIVDVGFRFMKIKNISLILFSLLILFSISGCSLKGNKINMNRIYGLDKAIEIDTTKRQELINNQRNFVLLIYNSECSSCETILNEVDSLVKDEAIEIY